MLAICPSPTGSFDSANTTGIVWVALATAITNGVPLATITLGAEATISAVARLTWSRSVAQR